MDLKKEPQERFNKFNLRRFFTIFSLGIIVFITVSLSYVFIKRQNNLIISSAISSAEEFAHQLTHRLYDENIISTVKKLTESRFVESSPQYEELDRIINTYLKEFTDIVKVKIYDWKGLILYSSDPKSIGHINSSPPLIQALNRQVSSELTRKKQSLNEAGEEGKIYQIDLLEIYVPIFSNELDMIHDGKVIGVFEIYKDVSKLFNKTKREHRVILFGLITSMSILFFSLYVIVRKADIIIQKKNTEIEKHNNELEVTNKKIEDIITHVTESNTLNFRYNNNIDLLECWEFKNCKKTDCPSYKSKNLRCWQVAGTFCGGKVQGVFAQKYGDCRKCEVYKYAFKDKINHIGESFSNMMSLLRGKHSQLQEKNTEIVKNKTELEKAQQEIEYIINRVVEYGGYDIRFNTNNDLLKCWEIKNCEKTDCPSYKSENLRCWQVAGTFCGGKVQGIFAQKYGDCRKCEVYQHAFKGNINKIGENFNNMMSLLKCKHLELEGLNDQLKGLVDTDPLTGIGNRRSFHKRIENIHLLSLRNYNPYSLIMCDIDNFKLYNDTYGHQKGDYVLTTLANALKTSLRRTDEIFRWGGEEFVIILQAQNLQSGLKVAENLRSTIETLGLEHKTNNPEVITISCGVTSNSTLTAKSIGWEFLLKEADNALYLAKTKGRNSVCSSLDIKVKA